jgi:hypothetical protein
VRGVRDQPFVYEDSMAVGLAALIRAALA